MVALEKYFDHQVDGIMMLDLEGLLPPDPKASWFLRETADGWTMGRRLELARADLDRLHAGWIPTGEVLAAAPILTNWRVVNVGGRLALGGTVAGHPGIAEGHRVLTSALIAFDAAGEQWARTVSRFYVLSAGGIHLSG